MGIVLALGVWSLIWNAPKLFGMAFEPHTYDGSGREERPMRGWRN